MEKENQEKICELCEEQILPDKRLGVNSLCEGNFCDEAKEWFSKEDKLKFVDAVKAQIEQHEEINKLYSNYNLELFKVVIDINLEHIENLKMLIS